MEQLEHEFDIPMENDMGEELNQMCNLSDYVEELGVKKGLDQGVELAKKAWRLHVQGDSPEKIAKECDITLEQVKKILE